MSALAQTSITDPVAAVSQPTTPNHETPKRGTMSYILEEPDEDTIDTPRRPQITLDIDDDQPTFSSSPFPHIPLRTKGNSSSPTSSRPHSSSGISSLPPMQRAYSSPGLDSNGRFISPILATPRRPSSPLSSGRRRSPLRSSFEEMYPSSYSGINIEPNIPEHAELEITSPLATEDGLGPLASISSYSNTFPRSRRRTTSSLHQSASAPSLHVRASSPNYSATASPSLVAARFATDQYPSYSYSSTSSMPSTPTSFRSRSPSISSLETIEDIPDAEEAAMLEDEEMRIRADDSDGSSDSRRRSLDLRAGNLRSNKERKRWSVCGAERRADFSLEPIEE